MACANLTFPDEPDCLKGQIMRKYKECNKYILSGMINHSIWPNSKTEWSVFIDWSVSWLLCLRQKIQFTGKDASDKNLPHTSSNKSSEADKVIPD